MRGAATRDRRPWRGLCVTALAVMMAGSIACLGERSPPPVSAVKVLIDREEVFPEVLELIASAEHEVLLSMYLLGGGRARGGEPAGIGRAIVDALAERQRAGVRVRVINTRFVAVKDNRKTVGEDDPWFTPVFDYARKQGLQILRPAPVRGGIDHTKYVVVDGREAIFGGMNLAEAVASNHDVMVRAAGPVARDLQRLFLRSWGDAVAASDGSIDPAALSRGAFDERRSDEELLAHARARVDAGWAGCDVRALATMPGHQQIRPAILEVLSSAERGDSLRISLLLFSEPSLVDAVLAAHGRGASVRVILDPNEAFYGVNCGGSLNASIVARLADAGVEVRHYAVEPGQEMHMKLFVLERADGALIFGSGSSNWTQSDMWRNWEVTGLFRRCDGPARRLIDLFDADWRDRTRAMEPALIDHYRDPAARKALSARCGQLLRKEAWLRGRR